ncbi:S-layer homology domain-containing protein [Paenibacillus sp. HB172176]|uniref:S-layer homology domain-containing protein n=1 Tax=Paenibacillus sp. HB172176 TaxID=2493690 RepID=UPI00143C266F|nr:S-layer homology domain-containing protein [Paenibacillus sp. HB172176]
MYIFNGRGEREMVKKLRKEFGLFLILTLLLSAFAPLTPASAMPDPTPQEVTATDSVTFATYMANPGVSVINLVGTETYEYGGGTVDRPLTINGNGASITVTGGVSGVSFTRSFDGGVDPYANVNSFLYVDGTGDLTINDVLLQGEQDLMLFSVIGVKSGGKLAADHIEMDNFFNNSDYLTGGGTNEKQLSFGILLENGSMATVQNSTFGSGNAFRQAISVYGDANILNNTFEGTLYPGRLRYTDGYEYAIYTYGGDITIRGNQISGYDSTNQPGYRSGAICLIAFYDSSVIIEGNTLTDNGDSFGVTGVWSGLAEGSLTINGRLLVDDSFQYPTDEEITACEDNGECTDPYDFENLWSIGESLMQSNTSTHPNYPYGGNVLIMLDQDDEVEIDGGFAVLGGYLSPVLTLVDQDENWAELAFSTDEEIKKILKEAVSVRIEKKVGNDWVAAGPQIDLTDLINDNADLTTRIEGLTPGQDYTLRLKMIHQSYVEPSVPLEEYDENQRNLITYSGTIIVDKTPPAAPVITSPVDGTSRTNRRPVVEGTAEPGSAVTLTIDGTEYSLTAGSDGKWSYTPTNNLDIGTHTFSAYATDAVGNVGPVSSEIQLRIYVPASVPVEETDDSSGIDILVNGKVENAGTAVTTEENGRSVTTVTVDPDKLKDKLEEEGQNAIVIIPVKTGADEVIGELDGLMVQQMAEQSAVLVIQTELGSYTLPAGLIDIENVKAQLDQEADLKEIKLQVTISSPTLEQQEAAEQAALDSGVELAGAPVNFTVKASYGDQIVEITEFPQYVERAIAIPSDIDSSRITTGVVIEADGTMRHVPTKIFQADGQDWAQINSLTNSLYAIVWNPLEFPDVAGHWSQAAVNDMGSRLIVEGDGSGNFDGERSITRAEFAASLVRALGLSVAAQSDSSFQDVLETDWFAGAVGEAYAYGLIQGFEDGSFRPDEAITRQEAMKMLAKAMALTGLQEALSLQSDEQILSRFEDSEAVAGWASGSIADCVAAGLVEGRGGNSIAPLENITRAETAELLQRLLQQSNLI